MSSGGWYYDLGTWRISRLSRWTGIRRPGVRPSVLDVLLSGSLCARSRWYVTSSAADGWLTQYNGQLILVFLCYWQADRHKHCVTFVSPTPWSKDRVPEMLLRTHCSCDCWVTLRLPTDTKRRFPVTLYMHGVFLTDRVLSSLSWGGTFVSGAWGTHCAWVKQ